MTITSSIIRITDPDGNTTGTGFIVATDLAVTCAHVVNFALGRYDEEDSLDPPTKSVPLVFYATGDKTTATVEGWRNPKAEDIAILRLKDPLPSDKIVPLLLGSAKENENQPFNSFGFKAGDRDEIYVTGQIDILIQEDRWLQLSSTKISTGVSGAPVFVTKTERVVGVISEFPVWEDRLTGRKMSGDSFDRQTEINYATPTEVLLEIWPELKAYLQPDLYTQKLKDYRDYIKEETQYVTMKGVPLPPEVGKVPLDEVYIQLQAVKQKTLERQRADEQEELVEAARAEQVKVPYSPLSNYLIRQFGEQFYRQGSAYRTDERPEPISPTEALKEHKRLVILGAPGSGKSTLLLWLARQTLLPGNELNKLIPILVSARDFSTARIGDTTISLRDFAFKQIKKHKPDLVDALQQADKQGKILWLVDALDEARGEHGRDVVKQVQSLTGQVAVTSRPIGYPGGLDEPQFKTFEVLPLVSENIEQFITNWFVLLEKDNQPQQAWLESRCRWFKDTIEKQSRLKPLMKNPLLLTFLVILASERNRQTLPENRSELYREYVEKIINNWEREREAEQIERGERILTIGQADNKLTGNMAFKAVWQGFIYLGWRLHRLYYGGESQQEPEKTHLTHTLADHLSQYTPEIIRDRDPMTVAEVIIQFWLEAGFLDTWETDHKTEEKISHKTYYTFRHLTFQEYAVAKYLQQKWQKNPDETWQEIKPHLYHHVWREPLLLLAGTMEREQLESLVDRVFQNSEPYDHPQRFFKRHKFISPLIIIPCALLLFPVVFVLLAVFVPGVSAMRLWRPNAKLQYYSNHPLITRIYEIIDDIEQWLKKLSADKFHNLVTSLKVWAEQWQEQFFDNKLQALLTLLKSTLMIILTIVLTPLGIFLIAWLSFHYSRLLSKYHGEKIHIWFLSKRLQLPNTKYLQKSLLAATQHDTLLAAQLIGENSTKIVTQAHVISSDEGARNPQGTARKSKVSGISPCGRNDMAEQLPKISDRTTELVVQRLAKLMRSDIPSLARAAAEAAAGVAEGPAGSAMVNILIQDIYKGTYWGDDGDDDALTFHGMPVSGRVLLQQARQKQMGFVTVNALLSEMNRGKQFEETISERYQIVQYMYLARYVLSNIRRFLNSGEGRYWIMEILGYYDGEPPDELVQIVSDEVEWRRTSESPKSDFTVHLAQRLVRWRKATPAALAVLASKLFEGSSLSKELFDTIAIGFSTDQISDDSAEEIIWCVVRWLDRRQEEDIKAIFIAILEPDHPHSDVARIAVLIAIEALDSEKILGYTERGPFSLITSIMSQILASGRVTDVAFDALAEGLAHDVTYVRETATKILQEALQAKPNLNTGQILSFLFKVLDNDEKEVRFLAARIIKDAIKANIINGELIEDLDPSGYNYEDAISDIQSYYQSRLNSASYVTTPTRILFEDRIELPEPMMDLEYYPLAWEAKVLSQKLRGVDKTEGSDREFWSKTLTKLKFVAKSAAYIPEEWLELFIQLYEDIEKKSTQDEKLISGLPGYESADKLATALAFDFKNKYGDKWPEYFKIANNVTDAREAMRIIVSILANAALNDTLNSASVEFLLRKDTLKYTTNFHFYITVYTHIAKCGFATLKLVETLLGFLDYTPSYLRKPWDEDKNPTAIYVLGQVYKNNPEFREQVLLAINQALLHNRYEEVDMVTKILKEGLIPASVLALVILESLDESEEISSSQTSLLGQLSTEYPVPAQYVKKIFNYILGKWTPLGWVRYLDGLGLMIQQEQCETEAFHLIVSRLLYGVHHLRSEHDEFRQPVARIFEGSIVQPEAIAPLFTVLDHRISERPDPNWLDAARFIGNVLNTQENEEKCLLSTLHYLLDDSDDAFGSQRTDWLKEITVQLLGFVDFQTNTDFLLDILRNKTTVKHPEMMRDKAVFALTQIGYRHPNRHEKIINAFQEVFFEEPFPLPLNDDSEFFDQDNTSLKMAIVSAIGNLQNYSLDPAKKILLTALKSHLTMFEFHSTHYPRWNLATVAIESLANINLEPDMLEEISILLLHLSSSNDQARDLAWKVLNTLDIEAITPANVN